MFKQKQTENMTSTISEYPTMFGLGLCRADFDFNDTRLWEVIGRAYDIHSDEMWAIKKSHPKGFYEEYPEYDIRVRTEYLASRGPTIKDEVDAAYAFLKDLTRTKAPQLANVWVNQRDNTGYPADSDTEAGSAVDEWLVDELFFLESVIMRRLEVEDADE